MKNRFSKFLALVLVLIMVVTALPVSAKPASGRDGESTDSNGGGLIGQIGDWLVKPIGNLGGPAQSFSTVLDGGLKIDVEVPAGAFAKSVYMVAKAVHDVDAVQAAVDQTDGVSGTVITAVDISFYVNKTEVQPQKDVTVTITSAAFAGMENLSVVHLDVDEEDLATEDPDAEPVNNVQIGEDSVVFNTRSFSVYAVIGGGGSGSVETLSVTFYDHNGVIINKQTIRKDQIQSGELENPVFDPGVPSITTSQAFEGWTTTNPITDETEGISVDEINDYVRTNYASISELTYYAIVRDVAFITFHDQAGVVIRLESINLADGHGDYLVNLSYTPFKGGWAHIGWTPVINNTGDEPTYPDNPVVYENGDTIDVTANIDLYPYLKEGYWLIFDNYIDQDIDDTSASFTAPKYYGKDEVVPEPTDYGDSNNDGIDHDTAPYRNGYTFGGWYTGYTEKQATDYFGNPLYIGLKGGLTTETTQVDEETGETVALKPRMIVDTWGEPYTWNTYLTEDTTVYAKWIPNDSSYLVVFMTQKASDEYDNDVSNNTYQYYTAVRRDWVWKNNSKQNSKAGDYVSAFTANSVTLNDTYLGTGDLPENSYYPREIDALGQYFEYSSKNDSVAVMVYGDGSSVLYVYYDRKPVTINFYLDNYSGQYVNTTSNVSTSTQYFYKSGNAYYPLHYSSGTSSGSTYHTWSRGDNVMYQYSNGYWYTYNGSWSSGSSSMPINFYYATRSNLLVSITGLYEHEVDEDDCPALNGTTQTWYFNEYNTNTAHSQPSKFQPPASYTGSDPFTVNYYRADAFVSSNTKTVHHITQDPETGAWVDNEDWYTTDVDEIYIKIFSDSVGHTLYGFNVYRNSRTTNFQSRPSDGLVYIGYDPEGGSTTTGHEFYGIQNNDAYVYYELTTANLVFRSKTGIVKERTLRYGQSFARFEHEGDNINNELFIPDDGGAGYYFDGWYTDESYQEEFDFTGTMPEKPVNVYAKWTKMRFRVVLDYYGGDPTAEVVFPANQASTFRVDYGEKVRDTAIVAATREGYTLLGWYLDTEGEIPFNFGEAITDEIETMDFSYVYGTGRIVVDEITGKVNNDDELDENGNPKYADVIGKLTIYALWRQNSVGSDGIRVRYDAIEGQGYFAPKTDPRVIYWDDPNIYSDEAKAFAQPASTAESEDYQFLYWVVMQPVRDGNGNYVLDDNGEPQLEPTQIKVYPGQTFTVDYNYTVQTEAYKITWNYRTPDGGYTNEVTTVTSGALPQHTDVSGYVEGNLYYPFTGWEPTIVAATENTAYTATYGPGEAVSSHTFTITWNNWDGITLQTQQYTAGQTPSYTGATPTKPADADYTYTFAGWTPDITVVSADATYTAKYTASTRTYSVMFNANGGSFSGSASQTVNNVTSGTLFRNIFPSTDPTNSNSSRYFLGWFTAATNGTQVNDTDEFDGSVTTLYAHWYTLSPVKDTSGELVGGEVYMFRTTSGSTNYHMYASSTSAKLTRNSNSTIPNGAKWNAETASAGGVLLENVAFSGYYLRDYSDDDYPGLETSGYRFLLETASSTNGTYYLYNPGQSKTWYIYYDSSESSYKWTNDTETATAFTVMRMGKVDYNATGKNAQVPGSVGVDSVSRAVFAGDKAKTESANIGSNGRGNPAPIQPNATATYNKVTTLTPGRRYLITYTSGSTAYIMGNNYNSGSYNPVTVSASVSGNTITGDYDSYLYGVSTATSSGTTYYQFGNLSKIAYIYDYNSGNLSFTKPSSNDEYRRQWTYSNNRLQNRQSSYYLSVNSTYSPSYFYTASSTSNATITIYERVEDASISGDTFNVTTTLKVGNKYIIAIDNVALGNQPVNNSNNDHFINAIPVVHTTGTNETITIASGNVNAATWEIVSGDSTNGFVFKNVGNDKYLGMSDDDQCYLAAAANSDYAVAWTYDNGTDLNNHVTESANLASNNNYYLYLSVATEFLDFTTSTGTGHNVKFYEVEASQEQSDLDAALNVAGGTLHFESTGSYPWTVPSGQTYAQSGNAAIDSSTSTVTMQTMTLFEGDTLTFKWYVSSESASYDYLYFSVNGTDQNSNGFSHKGGTSYTGFQSYTYTVPSDGSYTFSWTYRKDSSLNSGDDCARLDDVELTAVVNYTVTAVSNNTDYGTVSPASQSVPSNGSKSFTATPATGYQLDSVSISPNGAATATVNGNTITVSNVTANCTITVNFTAIPQYTVTYMANGASAGSDTAYVNSTINLPASATVPSSDYTFIGWVTAVIADETTTMPTFYAPGAQYTVTGDATLYALYSRTESGGSTETVYELLTSAPANWAGNYVVSYAKSGSSVNVLTRPTTTGSYEKAANKTSISDAGITLDGTTMHNVGENYVVTIAAGNTSGKYTLKMGSYYYGNNGTYLYSYDTYNAASCDWSLAILTAGNAEISSSNSSRYPLINYSSYFTVNSSTSNVYLWKETQVEVGTTYYTTNVGTYYTMTWNYRDAEGVQQTTTSSVAENETPVAPVIPETYTTSDGTVYVFTGWTPTIVSATAPATYTAQYQVQSYKITWVYKNASGEDIIVTTNAAPGTVPAPGFTPGSYISGGEEYRFTGWTPTIVAATGPATYTAQYSSTSYDITWHYKNSSGEWTSTTVRVAEGVVPAYNTHPIWEDSMGDQWMFSSWNSQEDGSGTAPVAATANADYWAQYTKVGIYTYTMYLYAVYGRANTTGLTHIFWYANNGEEDHNGAGPRQEDMELSINEPTDIPTPETFTYTTTRGTQTGLTWDEDHIFLGWARLRNEDDNDGRAHPELTEEDLYLKWDSANEKYLANIGTPEAPIWRDATQVAADESRPYHDMYAVWGTVFYVYHSGIYSSDSQNVQRIIYLPKKTDGKVDYSFNIAELTNSGYLYGGYYKDYAGKSTNFVAKNLSWPDADGTNYKNVVRLRDNGATGYDGKNYLWDNVNVSNDEAYTECGLAMTPTPGATYYIKEVPADKYLQPYLHYTYKLGTGVIQSAWVISDIDDLKYNETGFVIETTDHQARIAKSLTINTATGNTSVTLTAQELFGVGDSSQTKNRLSYLQVRGSGDNLLTEGVTIRQYWVTLDGVRVTSTRQSVYANVNNVAGINVTVTNVTSTLTAVGDPQN